MIAAIIKKTIKVSESGLESSHKSIIDKKTKTKEGKYLGDEVSNIQIPLSDSARLNVTRHVSMPWDQC